MTRAPKRRDSPYPARVPDLTEHWSAKRFYSCAVVGWIAVGLLAWWNRWLGLLALPLILFTFLGLIDHLQPRHAIRRNFPVLGRLRYMFEGLRPEFRQYFVEGDEEANPISREHRTIVYSRAKGQLDTLPFGTRHDVYADGYEWIHHSLAAVAAPEQDEERILIGKASGIAQPYAASVLNISAMSYGSLSGNAVRALSEGARRGNFAHNTGEGGVSPHHLEPGGDLIWQIGTGYFGCRRDDGQFAPETFAEMAQHPHVKMIELKLSQGAKPGHGGILPARKVTPEIAAIRKVGLGRDVLSPPSHRAFSTPLGLIQFIQQLRELSGGKPVGIKLCLGRRREFLAIVKAMVESCVVPDFVAVDGAEGGTGAAPLEFSNSVGTPLIDGLDFIHRALLAAGVREQTKLVASGKITTGFHILRLLALGADVTSSARAMMFALGCIQALKCNTNHCPVGVATQDPSLIRGLVVPDKAERVYRFHLKTVQAVYELLGAAGLTSTKQLTRAHIRRRAADDGVHTYDELYPEPEPGALLSQSAPANLQRAWDAARPDRFDVH